MRSNGEMYIAAFPHVPMQVEMFVCLVPAPVNRRARAHFARLLLALSGAFVASRSLVRLSMSINVASGICFRLFLSPRLTLFRRGGLLRLVVRGLRTDRQSGYESYCYQR